MFRSTLAALWIVCAIAPFNLAISDSAPVCPNPGIDTRAPYPDFAKVGEAPNVIMWQGLPTLQTACYVSLQSPAKLIISLAGSFTHSGSVDEIAQRLGAISETEGLSYWSVSDGNWRKLVSKAYAVETKERKAAARQDFDAPEVLSGKTLHFAQNDTRSWGLNIYSGKTVSSSADHLIFASHNSTALRVGPVRLFKAKSLQSVLFFSRLNRNTWQLYSLAVVRNSTLAAKAKSLINRQAAAYRYLIGDMPTKHPPLAP